MSITNAGNVGIGTTSPVAALDVAGGTIAGGAGNTTWRIQPQYVNSSPFPSQVRIANGWNPVAGTGEANYAGVGINLNSSQGGSQVEFYTSSTNNAVPTQRMVIRSTGNVGIGTASPAAALDVYGTTVGASFTTGCITNSGGSLNLNAGVNAVYFSTLGAVRVYVNASSMAPNVDNTHTCGAGGNRWVSVWSVNGTIQTSDSRHKDSAPLGYGLSEILQANTIMYSWKTQASLPDTDPEKNFKYFGVCADELVSVMPELCYAENPDVPIQINYSELIPVCMNAIKELSAENAQLKARLESLETRFTAAGF
jgi:hypothetical protein